MCVCVCVCVVFDRVDEWTPLVEGEGGGEGTGRGKAGKKYV